MRTLARIWYDTTASAWSLTDKTILINNVGTNLYKPPLDYTLGDLDAAFLLMPAASYITGACLPADGGFLVQST